MVAGRLLSGRYQVERLPLDHRGMAEVWPAHDKVLDRAVIIKVLPVLSDIDLFRRFRREALLTARMNHPGVPRIIDMNHDENHPYLVIEKVEGIALDVLVAEQGPLPIAWVAAIGAQMCAVLAAAHEIGLVHRDVKPSNVMLEPSGAVKVLDFGLATIEADERYSRITQTGESLGTVGYMAPEQITGEATDHRTDLYGLGAALFHLLTGRPPFDGRTTSTTVRHQLEEPPPRPATLRSGVPSPLDDLVGALLAHDPDVRPSSAAEVHAVLLALGGPRPALPGVIRGGYNTVQAYAAALVGSALVPQQRDDPLEATAATSRGDRGTELMAGGQFRAAARHWRQSADELEQRLGTDHPRVLELRRLVAHAHEQLGEPSRALRQLKILLAQQIRTAGQNDPTVRELRQEIAALQARNRLRDGGLAQPDRP